MVTAIALFWHVFNYCSRDWHRRRINLNTDTKLFSNLERTNVYITFFNIALGSLHLKIKAGSYLRNVSFHKITEIPKYKDK